METSRLKRNMTILIHILVWMLIGLLLFVLSPIWSGHSRPFQFWLKQGIEFLSLVGIFYFNYSFFIKRSLFVNKNALFLIVNLLAGFAYVGILILYDNYMGMQEIMHSVFRPNIPYEPRPRNYYWDISNLFIFYMSVGISTSIATVQKWQEDEKIRLKLEKEKTNSELSYLKAQINPHFFFNTLNNIYSLTNIDVEKAKTALLKLSRMMRYVLYETEKNQTLLSKELEFIKDFLELMRLRLTGKVKLDVQLPESGEEAQIAPMLLLPFIENCFKHGVSSQQDSPITIKLEKKGNELNLETKNTIFKSVENTPEGNASGIGLTNTMRRLDLLYPGKYTLTIDKVNPENEFRIYLNLKVS